MGRRESQLSPHDPELERFARDLRELRRTAGSPSYRSLSQLAHYSASALSTAANGRALPSLPVLEAYVRACGGDVGEWRRRWNELSQKPATAALVTGIAATSPAEPSDVVESVPDAPAPPRIALGGRRVLIGAPVALAATAAVVVFVTTSGSGPARAVPPTPLASSTLPPPGTACQPDVPGWRVLPEPDLAQPGAAVRTPREMDFATATDDNHRWSSWDNPPKVVETITSDVTYQGKKTMRVEVPTGFAMIGSTSMTGLQSRDTVTISVWYGGQGSAIVCPIAQEAGTFHEFFPKIRELSLTQSDTSGWRTYQWTIPDFTQHHVQGTAIEIVNTGGTPFVFYLGAVTW